MAEMDGWGESMAQYRVEWRFLVAMSAFLFPVQYLKTRMRVIVSSCCSNAELQSRGSPTNACRAKEASLCEPSAPSSSRMIGHLNKHPHRVHAFSSMT